MSTTIASAAQTRIGRRGRRMAAQCVGPFICDWTKDTTYVIDLTALQQQGYFDHAATMFFDFGGFFAGDLVTVEYPGGIVQEIEFESQGYTICPCATPLRLTITNQSNLGKTSFHFVNYHVSFATWFATAATR